MGFACMHVFLACVNIPLTSSSPTHSRPMSVHYRDYKRIEAASDDESQDKLNKSNGGPGI